MPREPLIPVRELDADPSALLGRWDFDRLIHDRRGGQRHHVDGRLHLALVAPGRISWHEAGVWHQPTDEVEVTRSLWLDHPAGQWWVRFEDGRDFHPWSPGSEVVHPCGRDTYRGQVDGNTQRWTVRWEVAGPDKDYTMTTVLSLPD